MVAGLGACSSPLPSGICATSITYTTTYTTAVNNDLDLVFVIDDGAAMAGWQAQLATQLPTFMAVLQSLPMPMGLHVGVVSSDLGVGAATNVGIPDCTASGDGGNLRSQPEATCTDTTLDPAATFISDIGSARNFTATDDANESGLAKVFQCIAQLGDSGCGFGQPLAALDRALGADGQPPPAANAGFLRPDAYLGIVIISNRDDCSVPAGSTLFSDDPAQGSLTHYRCNHAGHVCSDANGNQVAPPIDPPADAVSIDGVSTVSLTNCASNETGSELTPISKIVADIKSLKPDPDNQILVSALIGPPTPYAVEWAANAASGGAAGPRVAASCGTEGADGSGAFGEPAVRITQFMNSFQDSVVGSICDANYAEVLTSIATPLADDLAPPCLPADIQSWTDSAGNTYPDCVVTEHLTTSDSVQHIPIPACAAAQAGSTCWSLQWPGNPGCSGPTLMVTNEQVGSDPAHFAANFTISCQEALPSDAGATCPR